MGNLPKSSDRMFVGMMGDLTNFVRDRSISKVSFH